ncbi:MAG: hypothetical protein QM778_39325 [Myxococcales bacterium]
MRSKVARVGVAFWVMKIYATTLGETAGDELSTTLGVGYAAGSLILLGLFAALMLWQLLSPRFHPWLFWATLLASSVAGTTVSDFTDRTLGFGYAKGAALLVACLLAMLALWRRVEGSLRVDAIRSHRAELLYWLTILFSNTLGTALGDFLSDDSGLGFAASAAWIAGALLIVLSLWKFTKISHVALFWFAFVLTRPFGATFGDALTKPVERGGLDLGTAGSSLALLAIFATTLFFTTRGEKSAGAA